MTASIRLLSGLAGTHAVWAPVVDLLPDGAAEIPPTPWSQPEITAEQSSIDRFLAEICAGAEVVVAHSYAATLLLEYLTRADTTVRPQAVVLVSVFYRPRRKDFRWAGIARFLNEFDDVLASGITASATRRIDPQRLMDMARIVREQVGPYGWMAFYGAYLRTPDFVLSRVTVPLALVHGTDDAAAPITDSRALAAASDGRLHELTGVGHFPMIDSPTELFDVIQGIRSHSLTTSHR